MRVASVEGKSSKDAGIGAGVFETDDVISSVAIERGGAEALNVTVNTRADFTNSMLYVREGDTLRIQVKRGKNEGLVTLTFSITKDCLTYA